MTLRAMFLLMSCVSGPVAAEVTVRYLANEAYLVSDGERSVLLDAFVPEAYYGYAPLSEADWRAMLAGDEPFDDVVAAIASHEHSDHVQPEAAARFLAGRDDLPLFTTPAAASLLDGAASARAIPVLPDYGASVVHELDGVRLTFLRLAHRAEREADVENLGVIVEMDGVRILHLGDAYPDARNFRPFGLPALDIDLALVPEWFYRERHFPEGADLVREHIGADRVLMTHYALEGLEQHIAGFRERHPEVGHLAVPGASITIE